MNFTQRSAGVLPEEEQATKQARKDVLNARIRRWLKYRVHRLRKQLRTRLDLCKDPWAILLARLSSIKQLPKARQGYQQFMHEQYKMTIAPVVAEKWAETAAPGNSVQTAKDPNGPFRAKVARELFATLPEEEQSVFAARAKSEAAKPPSKAPVDRQDCIDRLGTFLAPVLQGIQELTGLHLVVVLRGPMPNYGDELKTIYVSYGRIQSARVLHFPEWAKDCWNSVLDLMKEYLAVVFSAQEKEKVAIPEALLTGAKYTIPPDPNGDDSDSESSESSDSNADSDDTDAPVSKKKTSAKKVKDVGVSGGRSKKAAPAAAVSRGTDTTRNAAAKMKERGGKAPKRKKKKGPRKDESESNETQDENDILATPAKKRRKKKTQGEGGSNASNDEDDYLGPSMPAATDKMLNKRARDGDDEPAPPTRKSRRLNPELASTSSSGPASAPPILAEPSTAMSASPATSPTDINPAAPASVPLAPSMPPATAPEAAPAIIYPCTVFGARQHASTITTSPGEHVHAFWHTLYFDCPSKEHGTGSTLDAKCRSSASVISCFDRSPIAHRRACSGAVSLSSLNQHPTPIHSDHVLTVLIRLEQAAGFEVDEGECQRLSTKKWLKQIAEWIRGECGTKSKQTPKIKSVSKFAEEWDAWWDSIQPSWRKRDANGKRIVGCEYGKDWG
ncbi:hypothetical protein FB451DRAFT_1395243 [Mycena latifolia]|nr:hypothetical protein FB451DRAFT_1395243 [Mycena latifolia]